jgi:hypothetical protein
VKLLSLMSKLSVGPVMRHRTKHSRGVLMKYIKHFPDKKCLKLYLERDVNSRYSVSIVVYVFNRILES